ncbi:MAG: cyclase/dehydrase, partial [Caulobacter sp.]|nr:cyclase/dehydrase [Caulobacter sp.]
MRGPTVLLALLALAGPARAQAVDPALESRLAAGEIYLEVKPDPAGHGGQVRAALDIAAPPAVVWKLILDCGKAGRMTPNVKQCKVLSRAPDGRSEVREHLLKWTLLLPMLRSVSRVDYEPYRFVRFQCIGGDIKSCDGEWRLQPLNDGQATRVTYENRAATPFSLPSAVAVMVMRHDVPEA